MLSFSTIFLSLSLLLEAKALSTAYRAQFCADLQSCTTPQQVLSRVVIRPDQDPSGEVARLALVRLSKQLLCLDNQHGNVPSEWLPGVWDESSARSFTSLVKVLLDAKPDDSTIRENVVEGIKALSVVSRLVPGDIGETLASDYLQSTSLQLAASLKGEAHLLSSLEWAVSGMHLKDGSLTLPDALSKLVRKEHIPFRVYPGLLRDVTSLTLNQLTSEVEFQVDEIQTKSGDIVKERRQTAWQGDDGIGPFLYSGKAMPRKAWSSSVESVRDRLQKAIGQYYDCCLLNHYPDGGSGMRYHIDPDQGLLWDFDTTVVSVGASRRFAFRPIGQASSPPHNFVVMHGDVCHMYQKCQETFQHTVKKAENRNDTAPRVSLVYKRTWSK